MKHWNDVVKSLGPPLLRAATRIVGNTTDAEDIVQTTFLEAYRLNQTEPVRNWHGLLRKILTHRAYDLLRKKRSVQFSTNETDVASEENSPLDRMAAAELVERLQVAISRLPKQQARVFWLRHFDMCTNDEIAETLGISPQSVAVALSKARKTLAAKFTESERQKSR